MSVFIEEEKRLNDTRKALIYLSLWQSLGAVYLTPDNGVVVSTGFDTEPDNSNAGLLGYIKDWVVRPTKSLFKLANVFSKETGRPEEFPSTSCIKLWEWKPLVGPISCLVIRVTPGGYTLIPTY